MRLGALVVLEKFGPVKGRPNVRIESSAEMESLVTDSKGIGRWHYRDSKSKLQGCVCLGMNLVLFLESKVIASPFV